MKVQGFRRLNVEDFQDAPEWFHRFLESYNETLEHLYTLLANNLTFEDNFNCEVKSFKIKDNTPVTVALTSLKGRPSGVFLLNRGIFDYYQEAHHILDARTIETKLNFNTEAPLGDVDVKIVVLGD